MRIFFYALAISVMSCLACNNADNDNEELSSVENVNVAAGMPALKPRTAELAKNVEWQKTKDKVNETMLQITNAPTDVRPQLRLVMIYLNEARVTGDNYYYESIISILNNVLKIEPNNFEARVFKASVAMSLHQYATAWSLAQEAMKLNASNAYVYGVATDAHVEMGNYEQAIKTSDTMQGLKPSLESYSRASYIREIFGDYPGALQAMKMAVTAGAPGTENAEWARTTLGDIFLNMGEVDSALAQYSNSNGFRPQFPNALIGMAKVSKYKGNYDEAIKSAEQAISLVSESGYILQLADLYELKGDDKEAQNIRKDVLELLQKGIESEKDAEIKHNANRELAQAYLALKDYPNALKYAEADLALRPENIDANELVAWTAYLMGNHAKAAAHADKMLKTGSVNKNLRYKAALIYTAAGNAEAAAKHNEVMTNAAKLVDPILLKHAKKG